MNAKSLLRKKWAKILSGQKLEVEDQALYGTCYAMECCPYETCWVVLSPIFFAIVIPEIKYSINAIEHSKYCIVQSTSTQHNMMLLHNYM